MRPALSCKGPFCMDAYLSSPLPSPIPLPLLSFLAAEPGVACSCPALHQSPGLRPPCNRHAHQSTAVNPPGGRHAYQSVKVAQRDSNEAKAVPAAAKHAKQHMMLFMRSRWVAAYVLNSSYPRQGLTRIEEWPSNRVFSGQGRCSCCVVHNPPQTRAPSKASPLPLHSLTPCLPPTCSAGAA